MVNITGLGNTYQKSMNCGDTQTLKSLILVSSLERKRSCHLSWPGQAPRPKSTSKWKPGHAFSLSFGPHFQFVWKHFGIFRVFHEQEVDSTRCSVYGCLCSDLGGETTVDLFSMIAPQCILLHDSSSSISLSWFLKLVCNTQLVWGFVLGWLITYMIVEGWIHQGHLQIVPNNAK